MGRKLPLNVQLIIKMIRNKALKPPVRYDKMKQINVTSFILCFHPIIVLYIIFFIDFIPGRSFSLSKSRVISQGMHVFCNCFFFIRVIYHDDSLASKAKLWITCRNAALLVGPSPCNPSKQSKSEQEVTFNAFSADQKRFLFILFAIQ